jgi:ATP-dependent RNA helicase RhlE
MKSFSELKLAEPLARALADMGHTTPTPIQSQAIPPALEGRDVMGIAQTGTGKTAGFTLPTLHKLFLDDIDPPKRGARVLILAPTRELAGQISEAVRSYGRHMMDLDVATVYGGVNIVKQIKRLVHGNDIIVATPGRLIDLLERKAVKISDVEVLILDEADQMLDMGFILALRKIVEMLPKERQTLFFSATLAPKIKQLSKQFLNNPVHVSVTPANTTAEKVEQRVYRVKQADKQGLLAVSLLAPEVGRSLVFTRTKHGADRVVKRLAKVGIAAVAIHGNKSQSQRQRALEAFKSGDVMTMIATDVAARGIDIPDISHVFNFEIPNVPEQYVHRIGRTARAQKTGIAIAFVDREENSYLRDINKLLGEPLTEIPLPDTLSAQVKKLSERTPLAPLPKRQPDPRKGRGKSKKKKGRFAKDRAAKDAAPKGKSEASREPVKQKAPRDGGKPRNKKPKKKWSDERSNEPRGRVKAKAKPAEAKPAPKKPAHKKPARPKSEGEAKREASKPRPNRGGNNAPRRRKAPKRK